MFLLLFTQFLPYLYTQESGAQCMFEVVREGCKHKKNMLVQIYGLHVHTLTAYVNWQLAALFPNPNEQSPQFKRQGKTKINC